MKAEGHFLFSIVSSVFFKYIELTPVLAQGDWWHIIPSAILTCLLPDIDHPKSLLGRRLTWISKPVSIICGHRGFTHSLLVVLFPLSIFYLEIPKNSVFPDDVIQGMVIGYASHIIADILTPAGVPLLWPCRWRFSVPILVQKKNIQSDQYLFYIILLIFIAFLFYNLINHNIIIMLFVKIINMLQL